MSKRWQKFKNWLIKKLGGYTKAEYEDWSRVPIPKPVPMDITARGYPRKISAAVMVPAYVVGTVGGNIKAMEELSRRLVQEAFSFIEFSSSDVDKNGLITVRASIRVLEVSHQ